MSKIKLKTTETDKSVAKFIAAVPDKTKQADSFRLIELMQEQSGCEPRMWGPAIIGFGSYHYKYETGHEGDAPLVGFSPRKAAISLYLGCEAEKKDALLKKLGKYKMPKGCIYIRKLEDIDMNVLKKMVSESIKYMKKKYKV